MTIATYSELVTEMGDWLNRSDLSAKIPTFIRLFESRMNRLLRTPEMEQTATITTLAGTEAYALPTWFREARQVYIAAVPRINLTPMSPQSLRTEFTGQESANSQAYALLGEQIVLAPVPTESDTLTIVYYRTLAGLDSGNASNWLLDNHPDAYLYGSLAEAYAYLKDEESAASYKSLSDEAVAQIRDDANRKRVPGGPLATRPAVIE
jgi:hypothetical protein